MRLRSRLALLTLALVLSAAVAGAPAGHAGGAVICPLTGGAPVCCGPPIARPDGTYCCANAMCGPPITITYLETATPLPRKPVNVYGAVRAAAAGTEVTLWRRPAAGRTFRSVARTTTDGGGNYSFTLHPRTNDALYVTAGSLKSATVVLRVDAFVPTRVRLRADGRLVLSGTVFPNHARERVVLQRAVGRSTVSVARTRLDARSRYRFLIRPRSEDHLWVLWPGDRRNLRSVTDSIHVHDGGRHITITRVN